MDKNRSTNASAATTPLLQWATTWWTTSRTTRNWAASGSIGARTA
jgi:hypothetical protein